MKLRYQYRFFYILGFSFLLWLLGYAYLIHPNFKKLASLQEKEQQIREEFTEVKSFLQKNNQQTVTQNNVTSKEPTNLLFIFLSQLFLHGISLETIEGMSDAAKINQDLSFNAKLSGNFAAFTALFHSLNQNGRELLIGNFTLENQTQNRLTIKADFLLRKQEGFASIKQKEEPVKLTNLFPFCQGATKLMNENPQNELSRISFAHMKMVGFLRQGKEKMAVILLPNFSLASVQLGSLVGLESAKVSNISASELKLLLPSHQEVTLSMSNRDSVL